MPPAPTEPPRPKLTHLQLGLLGLLVLLLLGSVGLRAYRMDQKAATSHTTQPAATVPVPGETEPVPEHPPTPIERALPYITEGSLFGLIGFALGYASRKFVKLALILLALFCVGLQALVWTGTVTVDWGSLVGKLNGWVFNLEADESITQFFVRRVASAGGMLLGYLIGFQRG